MRMQMYAKAFLRFNGIRYIYLLMQRVRPLFNIFTRKGINMLLDLNSLNVGDRDIANSFNLIRLVILILLIIMCKGIHHYAARPRFVFVNKY